MAEKEVDLTFVGPRVENLDSVEKVVVDEMAMIVVGFDLEVVELVGFERWRILIELRKSPIRILHTLYP